MKIMKKFILGLSVLSMLHVVSCSGNKEKEKVEEKKIQKNADSSADALTNSLNDQLSDTTKTDAEKNKKK